MNLSVARAIADELRATLLPGCRRIEIAGSVRRGAEDVGDLELVAIPKLNRDLFGPTINLPTCLDAALDRLVCAGRLLPLKGGQRYRQFEIVGARSPRPPATADPDDPFNLDLFIVLPPAQWGVIYAIRTGPAAFSHWLVTPPAYGGALPANYRVHDGCLWHNDVPLVTPEESDLFAALGLVWLDPAERRIQF